MDTVRIFLIIFFISILSSGNCFAQETSRKSEIIETYKGESWYMHFVVQGETVQSLALLYGVSNVEILRANPEIATGLKPNTVIRIPVKSTYPDKIEEKPQKLGDPSSSATNFHLVQPKETWYGISRQYNILVKDLITANPNIDTLRIGMQIRIPEKSEVYKVVTEGYAEHTVLSQETLYTLSKKYNTTIEELIRLNPSLESGLKTGHVIVVPASKDHSEELIVQIVDTVFINHKVERKETLYSISRLYGIELNSILKANPQFKGDIKRGQILKIPKYNKEIRIIPRSDTIVMGREINQLASRLEDKPCSKIKDHTIEYNIALLVPMQLELIDSIVISDPSGLKGAHEYVSFDFIQFYEGAIIAIDSMVSRGMNVRLHVFDTDYGDAVTKAKRSLNKPEMAKMDLIIGPFFAESFDLIADFAKRNSIPIVNPLSRRAELTHGNEFIIKMQPSSWSQYNILGEYLKKNYQNDNIVLVRRNQEENNTKAQLLKSCLTNDSANTIKCKEVIYSVNGWTGINNSLIQGKQNIIFIMTSDKAVLPALLRDLAVKSEKFQITVIGLPEWEELELDYNYLMKLNTHFFKPWFVDYDSQVVKRFLKEFRSKYVAEPEIDKYAFLGYDITACFLSALHDYGRDFTKCIGSTNYHGLSNDVQLYKNPSGGFENQSTAIYKYIDYKRVKLSL